MKDEIKGLIKRGHLYEYTKDGKRDQYVSPKNKSSTKIVDVVIGVNSQETKRKSLIKGITWTLQPSREAPR